MPGFSLLHTHNSIYIGDFRSQLDELLFFDEYSKTTVLDETPTHLGVTRYDSYPVKTYETDQYVVLLEGYLYDVSDTRSATVLVTEKLFRNDREWIKDWLLDRDAEFVLVAVEKTTGEAVILNDALARLPIYTYSDGESVHISRELGFVLESTDVEPDSMGVAQYLLFGYPLGERTLYENVSQVPPASVIRLSDGNLQSEQLHQFNINKKQHADKSLEENAANLTDLIASSVQRRANLGTNMVSLSGGLDSRALAACMTTNQIPYIAATYGKGSKTKSEVQAAKEVMSVLSEEWHEYQIDGPTSEHKHKMIEMKRGANTVGMAYILEFFERLQSDFGDRITYFTGDGGAKFSSWTPPRKFNSNTEIVEFLLADQTRFSMNQVERLSSHTRDEIKRSIYQRLDSYPEADAEQRFVHFLIRERSHKWGYHGEDRNRYYFWSAAPLYAYPVFEYAMGVPDVQKTQNKLYSKIIASYSDDVLDVSYANYDAPVDSIEYRLKTSLYSIMATRPSLREKFIENFIRSETKVDRMTAQLIQENMSITDEHPDVFSQDTVGKYTEGEVPCSPKVVNYLLTVLLSIREL